MSNTMMYDELDQAVTALIADGEARVTRDVASYASTKDLPVDLRELLEVATELECVARPSFKAQLKADLMDEVFVQADAPRRVSTPRSWADGENGNGVGRRQEAAAEARILPSLFGSDGLYHVQRSNFAASFALHVAAVGVFVAASAWMAQRTQEVKPRFTTVLTDIGVYVPEPAREQEMGGGGAGGDSTKLKASHGQPPKFDYEQFTPPVVVVRNPQPVLPAVPTVLGPPTLPQLSQLGDPLSRVVPASNGTGSGGGMGSNAGTGVGNGGGAGAGLGTIAGSGGNVFRIGGGVSAPRTLYAPDPEYSEEARKAKYQGTVILWAIIGADGLPKDLRVQRALGMGLDQKALEAVRKWRFEPAMKGGQPVAVQVNIELNFRLY